MGKLVVVKENEKSVLELHTFVCVNFGSLDQPNRPWDHINAFCLQTNWSLKKYKVKYLKHTKRWKFAWLQSKYNFVIEIKNEKQTNNKYKTMNFN